MKEATLSRFVATLGSVALLKFVDQSDKRGSSSPQMASDPHLQQQLQGMSLNNPPHPGHHYPAVPQPAPVYNVPAGYPTSFPAAANGAQYPPANGVPSTASGIGGNPGAVYAQHAAPAGSNPFAAHSSNGNTPAAPQPGYVGSGWTSEAVKPEHAAPGQSAGHYGHLQ